MGLDMNLVKKTYVKNWQHTPEDEKFKITITRGGKPCADIKPERIREIVEDVMDWRKANAVHGWIVEKVQGGVDDCGEYYFSKEKMRELLEIVDKVLIDNSLAGDLLPPTTGFFFGSYDIDDYYLEDLKYTKEGLEKILKDNTTGDDYYYSSSW
jgi:hypothetical protein